MSDTNKAFLHQFLALVTGAKQRANSEGAQMQNELQKPVLFSGFTKTYQPKEEGGETYPPEKKRVERTVPEFLAKLNQVFSEFLDFNLTIDMGNQAARADVIVDGIVLLKDIPVTTLLFLEHQLDELKKFCSLIPTLDAAKEWQWEESIRQYKTDPTRTGRTKKTESWITVVPATKEHPAQVQKITSDEMVGYWNTIEFSGAIKSSEKADMLERVIKLQQAVKFAREKANSLVVEKQEMGSTMMNYLLLGQR